MDTAGGKVLETAEDIQERRQQVLDRYRRFKELSIMRRQKLEDSYRFQFFRRDADELEKWIQEKLQIASDENYKDPSNLQVCLSGFCLSLHTVVEAYETVDMSSRWAFLINILKLPSSVLLILHLSNALTTEDMMSMIVMFIFLVSPQGKLQKHQAFEAEVQANAGAIIKLDDTGNLMITEGHFASETIRVSDNSHQMILDVIALTYIC